MKKYLKLFILALFVPFFITNVYAEEPMAAEILSNVEDSYVLDVTEGYALEYGANWIISQAIYNDLLAKGYDLNTDEYYYSFGLDPENIYQGNFYLSQQLEDGTYFDEFKEVTISYANTGSQTSEGEEIVSNYLDGEEEIVFEEAVPFEEIDTFDKDEFYDSDKVLEKLKERSDDDSLDIIYNFYGGAITYFDGGFYGPAHFIIDDVWYGSCFVHSSFYTEVFVPYIVKDAESYALELLKAYLVDQGEEVGNLVFSDGHVVSEDGELNYGKVVVIQDEGKDIGEKIIADSIYEDLVAEPLEEEVVTTLEEIASEKGYEESYTTADVHSEGDFPEEVHLTFEVGSEYEGKEVLVIIPNEKENETQTIVVEDGKAVLTVSSETKVGVFLPKVEEEPVEEDTTEEVVEVVEAVATAAPVAIPAGYSPYLYGTDPVVVAEPEEPEVQKADEPKKEKETKVESEEKPQNRAVLILILVALIIGVIYFMYMGSRD